jgi:hypothetical protein
LEKKVQEEELFLLLLISVSVRAQLKTMFKDVSQHFMKLKMMSLLGQMRMNVIP